MIFDLYILRRGLGMSSLQTHSNYSVLQLTESDAVNNSLFDVIRRLEGKWGRVNLLCVVTPMSQDVALCWAPASSNRLILLLYPVPIPSDSFVYAELRTRSYKSQRARAAVDCNCDHCICGMRLPAKTCSQRTLCELFDLISSYLIDIILSYDKLSRISWIFNKYFSQLMNIIFKLIN